MREVRRVLAPLIDDEPFARLSAVQVLVDQAYLVLEAADAEEALQLLDQNDDVSVVITDIAMPCVMDGLALARKLRQRDRQLALVVATGEDLVDNGDLPAATQYLAKPYAARTLLSSVRVAEEAVEQAEPLSTTPQDR